MSRCKCISVHPPHPSMKRRHSWADLIWVVVYAHYSCDTDISHPVLYCQRLFCAASQLCSSLSLLRLHLNKKGYFNLLLHVSCKVKRCSRIRIRSWFSHRDVGIIMFTWRAEKEKRKRATSSMKKRWWSYTAAVVVEALKAPILVSSQDAFFLLPVRAVVMRIESNMRPHAFRVATQADV